MIVPYPTGLEPKSDEQDIDAQAKQKMRNAFRMILFRLIADVFIAGMFLFFARRTGVEQYFQIAYLVGLLVLFDIVGLVLVRRVRVEQASILVISSLLFVLPIVTTLVADQGIPFGLTAVIMTAISTMQVFPAWRVTRMVFISLVIGFAILILDEFFPAASRVDLPAIVRTIVPLYVIAISILFTVRLLQQFRFFTLRSKLIIAFLFVSLIPLAFLAYLNERSNRIALTSSANQTLFAAASKTASSVDNLVQKNLDSVQAEAQIPLLREFMLLPEEERNTSDMRQDVLDLLDTFQSKDPEHIVSYSLLDKEARVVADTARQPIGELPPFVAIDRGIRDNFRLVLLVDLPSMSPIKFYPATGKASIYFTARVSDFEGKPIGGLIARYDGTVLQGLVEQSNGLAGEDSFGVLFDDFNIHLAHGTAPETIFKSVALLEEDVLEDLRQSMRLPMIDAESLTTDLPELEANLSSSDDQPFFMATDAATGARLNQVAVAQLETQPWKVAFFQPDDVFLAPVERQTQITIILAVVFATLVVLAALSASEIVSSPIKRLSEVAVRISEGELTARAPVESQDEIGGLAEIFNRMTDRLQGTLRGLEGQVAARTADLQRRARQLQTASEVAQEAAAIRDIDLLLNQTVHKISRSFDFYHCGIFLVDELGEYAVLQAASSEGGQKMLARGHKLRVGKKGIVGYVAGASEPRIALDVGTDAVYFDNPDLPATRSEMALPLKIQDRLIGVLDVQSTKESAFTTEDIEVLQIMADQIALAIENARLLEATQNAFSELESLYKRDVGAAWKARIQDQPIAYRYDRVAVEPLDRMALASMSGKNGDEPLSAPEDAERTLRAPIKLRGQSIGTILLKREGEQDSWTPEDHELVQDVVIQLSLALENTRLHEITLRRAERERLIAEATARIRRSLDIQTVLMTASREMQQMLKLDQAEIRLGKEIRG